MSTMGAGPVSQSEMLQKLEKMGNLESVVTEQRMRIEKLKTTYETLKAEHIQLQETMKRKDRESAVAKEEIRKAQEECQDLVRKARQERDLKIQECEELRAQVLSPQKMDVIRARLQEEMEDPFRQKMEQLEQEAEKYRNEYNKLRYDYSFLKSEYEHSQSTHKQVIEELQAQHQTELGGLMKERDILIQQRQEPTDTHRLRILQRENTQMNMKIKGLLSELDEIRAQREQSGLQSDHVSRLQARQLSELTGQFKSLETERDSLKLQCQRLQVEHEKNTKSQDEMSEQLNKLERENTSLKSQSEEMSHKHKVEISNLRIELMKNKGDLERDKDGLQAELSAAKQNNEVLEQTIQHLKDAVKEKEDEVSKRVQAAKQGEWEKITTLEQAKLQLEAKMSEMERSKVELDTAHHNQVDKLEESIKEIMDEKATLERENNQLRSQVQHSRDLGEELEKEKVKCQELKHKHQQLNNVHQSTLSNEQQLLANNDRLKGSLDLVNQELEISRSDLQRLQEDHKKNLEQQRQRWLDEKRKLDDLIESLQKRLKEAEEELQKTTTGFKKKQKKYKKEIKNLSDSIQLLEAKEEQLNLEKDAVKKNLELEKDKIRKQFEKLQKRQTHFKNVLNASNVIPGILPITSSPAPLFTYQDQQRELATMRNRLDDLAENQQRNFEEFFGNDEPTIPHGNEVVDDV